MIEDRQIQTHKKSKFKSIHFNFDQFYSKAKNHVFNA